MIGKTKKIFETLISRRILINEFHTINNNHRVYKIGLLLTKEAKQSRLEFAKFIIRKFEKTYEIGVFKTGGKMDTVLTVYENGELVSKKPFNISKDIKMFKKIFDKKVYLASFLNIYKANHFYPKYEANINRYKNLLQCFPIIYSEHFEMKSNRFTMKFTMERSDDVIITVIEFHSDGYISENYQYVSFSKNIHKTFHNFEDMKKELQF